MKLFTITFDLEQLSYADQYKINSTVRVIAENLSEAIEKIATAKDVSSYSLERTITQVASEQPQNMDIIS
jgi:hypothetical protein